MTTGGTPALAGIKVIELARILAGPFAGQILADLGAEVIKVESPAGDDTRQWGPPWVDRADGNREASYYHACNRGKRGVIADFNDPADLAFVRALIADADVVIENYKLGTLARFGLDYETLSADNPGLVYCSITGFGQTGPYAPRPGYDYVIQGMSGMMSLTGEPDGAPMRFGLSISDMACGLYSTIAIQAALLARANTGRGQQIDMSLLDCSVGLLANQAMSYFVTGEVPPRMGNAHASVVPYQVYALADGHLIVATANDGQFLRLARLLGLDALADDPRLQDNAGRLAHRDEMNSALSAAMAVLTKAVMRERCEANNVPVGPINRLDEVFADPQVVARGMKVELSDGLASVRSPIIFSDASLALGRASPMHGEHDAEIRGAMGLPARA